MRVPSGRRLLLSTLCLVLLLAPSAGAACQAAAGSVSADRIQDARRAVRCLLNEIRAQRGLRRLHANRRLRHAARRHSQDMVAHGYFGHSSPDGDTVVGRARAAGYLRSGFRWAVGENIGWGTGTLATPDAMVQGWMNSPPHAANVLSAAFRDVGIGIALGSPSGGDGVTYTADFGARGR